MFSSRSAQDLGAPLMNDDPATLEVPASAALPAPVPQGTSSSSSSSNSGTSHPATPKRYLDATWPDPAALPHRPPRVDDVSRLNNTEVERVFEVRTVDDVKAIVRHAASEGRQVSVRGTQHSMGGHTIAPNGYVLDMGHFDRLAYDPATELVTAGTGAHWTDLIRYLNQFGLSPRTMQSYSSFSVGGTISVNAHGITTDYCLAESVVSFVLVTAEAEEVVCSRTAEDEAARELFSLAIGGYGLFGIITEVTLKVNPNLPVEQSLLRLSPKEFPRVYKSLLAADPDQGGDVDIKLARLDITTLEHIELYLFRRTSSLRMASPLELKPREMSLTSRLIYKWLAPTLQELRFMAERALGTAFDWSQTHERNSLMYESAVPLAKLYSPLLQIDDTFILQEYFVPQGHFVRWLEQAKPVYQRIAQHKLVALLNTTIRFVRHDPDTRLAYARHPDGVYAFVLYYRIRRSAEADAALQAFHHEFAELTLGLGGTFYLPYRHHYSHAQLERAYGRDTLVDFMRRKEKYDPACLFSSLWLRHYAAAYASEAYRERILGPRSPAPAWWTKPIPPATKTAAKAFEVPRVSERRTDSYRRLFQNPVLRRQFQEEFLVRVFNIEDPNTLYRLISTALYEPDNKTDLDVYAYLQTALAAEAGGGPLGQAGRVWKQLKQLREQKDELARETLSLVSRLGKLGQLHDYVSIGDNGKMVLPLREALGMRGRVWIVHDVNPDSVDIPVILERGSVEPLGTYVSIDYANPVQPGWVGIPDESADLVTMNQGLHHLPQAELLPFLAEVRRVLRPGGLFIVREHNATQPDAAVAAGRAPTSELDLIPMLDIAHSVFNAVTGVPLIEERHEIRAFRPVLEWRAIIEAAGLVDTMVYAVQHDDPTIDEMMCFFKPPFTNNPPREDLLQAGASGALELPAPPPLVPALANLFKEVPKGLLDLLRKLLEGVITGLPELAQMVASFAATSTSPGISLVVKQETDRVVSNVQTWLERFRPFIESSSSGSGSGDDDGASLSFLPPELLLIIPALHKKVAVGKATPMEMMAVGLLHDLQAALATDTNVLDKKHSADVDSTPVSVSTRGCSPADVTSKLRALVTALPELLDPATLDTLEVPPLAQRALRSVLAATTSASEFEASGGNPQPKPEALECVAEFLAQYLDRKAWKQLSAALDVIVRRKVAPPTLQAILQAASSNRVLEANNDNSAAAVWARALSAVLASPLVYPSRTQLMQLRLVGIDGVYKAWDVAQKRRNAQAAAKAGAEDEGEEEDDAARPLREALKPFVEPPTHTVTMAEGHFHDLHDVAEVVHATYGYVSLTAGLTDVTELVAELLKNNTVRLAGVSSRRFQQKREHVPGIDRLRKAITFNVSELKVTYRPILETDPAYGRKVDQLLVQLAETGWVKPLHPNDGHFTWFKLPEWMQVEFVQIFGQSMHHKPWYTFPFLRFIKLYFQVLFKEVGIVRSEHGLLKALFSDAFFIDLIPGVVMFFLFLQLQLLALPTQSLAGEPYPPERYVEQLVLLVPSADKRRAVVKWHKIDERITAQQVTDELGLFVLTVPTYKPFTEILLKLAQALPGSQVLEISNQRVVQVKVLLPRAADTDEAELALQGKLGAIPGCRVMFPYRFPVDGSPAERPSLCLAMRVETLALVRFIHECTALGVSVEQVYDFLA